MLAYNKVHKASADPAMFYTLNLCLSRLDVFRRVTCVNESKTDQVMVRSTGRTIQVLPEDIKSE